MRHGTTMNLIHAIALAFSSVSALYFASSARAVDVWTVGVNNTRQGWNKFETVLTPANVPRLKKIRERLRLSSAIICAARFPLGFSPTNQTLDCTFPTEYS